ncbi:MAG TPA: VWA domain-containing protein [Bryobacteraceae bacterium]|nr:VWA domain-containing protein [Bryobacteraceae bacterium]
MSAHGPGRIRLRTDCSRSSTRDSKPTPGRRLPAFCFLFFVSLIHAFAQDFQPAAPQAAPPDTVIRINVNLVQVDAVVTDAKGKPVTDLKPEDFEILQDGKAQVITNFSYISTRPGEPAVRNVPAAAPLKGVPPPPAPALTLSQVRRTVALVVDDLGLSFESVVLVRRTLKRFVDQQMRPGDLVAVIRTGAGMGALQQFTADKRLLYAAIDRVKYNPFGRVGLSSFSFDGSGGSGDTRFDEAREEVFSVGTLGAIRYVVGGLHDLPGRKSVILFSENLRLFNSQGMNERVLDAVRSLTDAANRASVVIYGIDPRGLPTLAPTAADDLSGMSPRQLANLTTKASKDYFNSQDGMVMLAEDTGGLFFHDTNDLDGSLRKAMEDAEGYYLIGYHPDASTFDAKTGQPKFHHVKLRVKVAHLHVRTRAGFYGRSGGDQPAKPRTRQQQLAHALASPFVSGELHLRLTTLFSNAAKAGSFLTAYLYFDPKELKFTEEPDGYHKAVIDVVAMTFGDNGQAVNQSDRTYTLRIKGKSYAAALKNGFIYTMQHPIKKPGAYQMRVALRDASTGKVGSASQFIEVPDVRKGHLTLSGIVLKEEMGPAPAAGAGETAAEPAYSDPGASAAVRIFKPGHSIVYGFQILNAQSDSGKSPELEMQTRLFRDGQQIYQGKPMDFDPARQPDSKRLIAAGRMMLGSHLAPGDYVLQVIVTDKLAKEKYRVAAQSMDFELAP